MLEDIGWMYRNIMTTVAAAVISLATICVALLVIQWVCDKIRR